LINGTGNALGKFEFVPRHCKICGNNDLVVIYGEASASSTDLHTGMKVIRTQACLPLPRPWEKHEEEEEANLKCIFEVCGQSC
jgi:hypothetical protein